MKIEERYRLYDEAVTILEKEIRIVFESILEMERAAANATTMAKNAATIVSAVWRVEFSKLVWRNLEPWTP